MTNINFESIKTELLENGLINDDFISKADEKVIVVKGEFDRFGNINISDILVGLQGNGLFFKGISIDIDLPDVRKNDDTDITESNFKADIAQMYKGVSVNLLID